MIQNINDTEQHSSKMHVLATRFYFLFTRAPSKLQVNYQLLVPLANAQVTSETVQNKQKHLLQTRRDVQLSHPKKNPNMFGKISKVTGFTRRPYSIDQLPGGFSPSQSLGDQLQHFRLDVGRESQTCATLFWGFFPANVLGTNPIPLQFGGHFWKHVWSGSRSWTKRGQD